MSSLYIHIPFCKRKCIYCDFYSVACQDVQVIDDYIFALEKEIKIYSENKKYNQSYDTIFIGGGTPSILQPFQIYKLLNLLNKYFCVNKNAEVTIEVNPGTVTKLKLTDLRSAGINRLSIGVQSFNDDDLKFLSRIHTSEEAMRCIEDANLAGFDNVSVDLIFSLPNQTKEKWLNNLQKAVILNPQHISCYSLIVEPDTVLFDMTKTCKVKTLSEQKDTELYEVTMSFLANNNYKQYEISNFAQQGYKCLHNINYWNHNNYLGFGASAHSFWNNERWWNVSDILLYKNLLEKNLLPIDEKEELSVNQLIEEEIFLGLRSEGVNISKLKSLFNYNFLSNNKNIIDELIKNNQAKIEDNVFSLTSKGYIVCDEICARLK